MIEPLVLQNADWAILYLKWEGRESSPDILLQAILCRFFQIKSSTHSSNSNETAILLEVSQWKGLLRIWHRRELVNFSSKCDFPQIFKIFVTTLLSPSSSEEVVIINMSKGPIFWKLEVYLFLTYFLWFKIANVDEIGSVPWLKQVPSFSFTLSFFIEVDISRDDVLVRMKGLFQLKFNLNS